jgi:hypothetical protein
MAFLFIIRELSLSLTLDEALSITTRLPAANLHGMQHENLCLTTLTCLAKITLSQVNQGKQTVTRYRQYFHFQGHFLQFLFQGLATIRHSLITVIRMLRTDVHI